MKLIASLDRQRPVLVDPLADRDPLDVFEGDVVVRPVLADAVDPRDVLVVELGRGPALLVEPLDDLGVARLVRRQELQGDVPIELGVVRAEDGAHPADADRLLEQECPDHLAGMRHRCR